MLLLLLLPGDGVSAVAVVAAVAVHVIHMANDW